MKDLLGDLNSVEYLNYLIEEIENGNLTNIVPDQQIENHPKLIDTARSILNVWLNRI